MNHSAMKRILGVGTGAIALVLVLLPAGACAGPRSHGGWERGPDRHRAYAAGHRHYRPVRVRHRTFYHHRGLFYRKGPRGFVAIGAPIGAVVPSLPPGFSVYGSGRNTFYFAFGTAYQRHPKGFVVVKQPYRHRSWHSHRSVHKPRYRSWHAPPRHRLLHERSWGFRDRSHRR